MATTRRLTCPLRFDTLESRDNPASSFVAVGAAAGGSPLAQLIRPDGTVLTQVQAFETGFAGGVRAAVGEVDGNPNTVELVAAAGPGGGPRVKVYSVDIATGRTTQIADFFSYEPSFTGGTRVAVGDVGDSDGRQEIVVGADAGGGPRVRTFELDDAGNAFIIGGPLGDFFAYEPGFRGGVRVAAGELDGNTADGDEVLVAAGPTGGPRVRVFRNDGAILADYFAFRPDFLGGVNVGVESSGGTVDTVRVDGLAADFSQRSAALNATAGVGQTTTTPTTGTTGGTTLGGTGTNVTGTAVGTAAASASATPAVQLGGTSAASGVTGGGPGTTGIGAGGLGSASTGFGTGVGLGAASTGFGTGLGLGSATTGAGSGGLTSAGASAGSFTTGGFGTSAFGSAATNGSSVGTTTVGTGTASTGTVVNNTAFGTSGSAVGGFGTAVGANGLAVGSDGLPVAFAGADGSVVFADNAGTVSPFPALLTPPFADGFGTAGTVA